MRLKAESISARKLYELRIRIFLDTSKTKVYLDLPESLKSISVIKNSHSCTGKSHSLFWDIYKT